MRRMVSSFLLATILMIAFSSCGTNSDTQDYVVDNTEVFFEENFQLEDSNEFLQQCLFPVAFREKWLENWETTRELIASGSPNPLAGEDLINRLDMVHRECGGTTLSATDYGRLRGIVVLNRSLNQSVE
ncbi:MAG: hypothetical protein VYC14_06500 [Actinomycetota bacterium]|nr:hypothetical protein [Actinomycetota bacterium]